MKETISAGALRNRRQRLLSKKLPINLLLLILPSLAIALLVFAIPFTFFCSLLLAYFVLPMFYTVEKRIRADISGIGNPDFSYADGYKAFFKGSQGGIFGVILGFFYAFTLGVLGYLIFQIAIPSLCGCFPESSATYSNFATLLNSQNATYSDITDFIANYGYTLARPLTIFAGLILFIPIFVFLFFSIDDGLANHYLATIVLPDIDKNLSASQSKAIARNSFGRLITGLRLKLMFQANWPYYLIFTALYGGTLYGFSTLQVGSIQAIPFLVFAAPGISLTVGFFLNYFCLGNTYAIVEESQLILLNRMVPAMRQTIYNTYNDSHYLHGEESAARGSFIPTIDTSAPSQPSSPAPAPEPAPVDSADDRSVRGAVNDFSSAVPKNDSTENGKDDPKR